MKKYNKLLSIQKFFEIQGQFQLFGRDNISFKTINLPIKQKYINLCYKFKLKKLVNKKNIYIKLIYIRI